MQLASHSGKLATWRRASRAQVALTQGRTAHAGAFAQATVRPVTFDDFLAAVNKIRGA